MLATGHQVFGVTWGIIAITLFMISGVTPKEPLSTLIFFGFILIGSLFPDIDTPKSQLGRYFWTLAIIIVSGILTVVIYFPTIFTTIPLYLKSISLLHLPFLLVFSGHRKFTHSLLFFLLLCLYSLLTKIYFHIPLFYFTGFLCGVASHLIGDYITKRGIPLFYPFSKKYFKFVLTFRTGSSKEHIITSILTFINIIYFISLYFF